MPRTITLTFKDGTTHQYENVPDDITPDAVMSRASKDFKDKPLVNIDGGRKSNSESAPQEAPSPAVKEEPPERGIGSTLLHAAGALPGSMVKLAQGLGSAVANPGQTAGTVNDLLRGALMKVPGAKFDLAPEDVARAQATVNALTNDYADTYGSARGFKNKLATDPMGPILDLSTVLSGGAAAAGKASTLGKVATAVNPMRAVEAPVNALASYGAKTAGAAADIAGGLPGARLPDVPTAAKVIPGARLLSKGVTLANGTLDLLQGTNKLKGETITKLSEGMATGKSANELLATLPTSEQSKLLQLLQSNPHWLTNPAVQGSAQGVNMLDRSEPK